MNKKQIHEICPQLNESLYGDQTDSDAYHGYSEEDKKQRAIAKAERNREIAIIDQLKRERRHIGVTEDEWIDIVEQALKQSS